MSEWLKQGSFFPSDISQLHSAEINPNTIVLWALLSHNGCFSSHATGHRTRYVNNWNNGELFRRSDNHRVGNSTLSWLYVNTTITAARLLPREHINIRPKRPHHVNYWDVFQWWRYWSYFHWGNTQGRADKKLSTSLPTFQGEFSYTQHLCQYYGGFRVCCSL